MKKRQSQRGQSVKRRLFKASEEEGDRGWVIEVGGGFEAMQMRFCKGGCGCGGALEMGGRSVFSVSQSHNGERHCRAGLFTGKLLRWLPGLDTRSSKPLYTCSSVKG